MLSLQHFAGLAVIVPVMALAGCQHMAPKGSSMEDQPMAGQTQRMYGKPHDSQQRQRMMHKDLMAKACEGHTAGDATTLQTPRGELKGQCQLMFVPDQPPAFPRSQQQP